MRLPLKPSNFKIRRTAVKWIILHHTIELYEIPSAKIDTQKYQLPAIFKGVLEQKTEDINYHYIIEKVEDDYIPIVCRPLPFLCEWDDIDPNINKRAVHVAFLGDYNLKIPTKRLMEVTCYRLINPLLRIFHLNPNKIKLHRDVSSNKNLTCPGDFFDMASLESLIRRFVIK